MTKRILLILLLILAIIGGWSYRHHIRPPAPTLPPITTPSLPPHLKPKLSPAVKKMLDSAYQQVAVTRSYDPRYVQLSYPGGDVPASTGVCADVVVRALRANGVDLQQALHEDMRQHFNLYPKKWGKHQPDSNIDHRRVYNLMTFFERKGKSLPTSDNPADYLPGDIVAWDLGEGQGHIGIVAEQYSADNARPLMIHNIGEGTSVGDVLFGWKVIGHYRYF